MERSRQNRWETKASIEKLAALFNLPTDPSMQNWAIEVASADRLLEYVIAYETVQFEEDAKFALMQLIIASTDDALASDQDIQDEWRRTEAILLRDFRLHASTLGYWSCPGRLTADEYFHVTTAIRHTLEKIASDACRRII
jgi:hypothetical protein